MPQSFSNQLLHIVFSTKERRPLLDSETRNELYAYMSTVSRNLKCECYRVGGTEDHVHLAIRLHRTISLSDYMEHIKITSSKWIKPKSAALRSFSWQRGYGAFSFAFSDIDSVLRYIDDQEEHHRKLSFQAEFRAFLVENGIEFDEKYIWD